MSFVPHIATAPPTPSSSLAHLSLSEHSQSNPIDLTLDDDDDEDDSAPGVGNWTNHVQSERDLKRRRIDSIYPNPGLSWLQPPPLGSLGSVYPGQTPDMRLGIFEARSTPPTHSQELASHIPPFVGSSHSSPMHQPPAASPPIMAPSPFVTAAKAQHESKQVIDLTTSPSPPPESSLPSQSRGVENLPPRTPVCIGQLQAKALILYPVSYLRSQAQVQGQEEWADVRLHADNEPTKSTTIHISTPYGAACSSESPSEESFALVEASAAKHLGPMLFKGLIRLEGKIKRGSPNVIFPPMNQGF
jgi:SWI/SNF-related matrix-associated actin-dependent regulator of chromatin subfamily A3